MFGADAGIISASACDQEPERKVRFIWAVVRAVRKAVRISGVRLMSPVWQDGDEVCEIRGGVVVVAQVRRRLGRVARRRTEAL
jgi:hypothetical protein